VAEGDYRVAVLDELIRDDAQVLPLLHELPEHLEDGVGALEPARLRQRLVVRSLLVKSSVQIDRIVSMSPWPKAS
jgi:hypothetical protein